MEPKAEGDIRSIAKCGNSDVLIKPTIEVVIPTLNEAKAIGQVLRGVRKYADRILVIDGHSSDGTAEIARKLGARVVMQNSSGKGSALREAFEYTDCDIIVMIDADGSMKPREIPSLVEAMAPGVDLVKGSRFLPGGYSEDMSFIRKIGNWLFLSLVNGLWSTNYTDLCYGLGAIRKEALERLFSHLKSESFEIETEICIKAKKLGLKVVEVPSIELRRRHGKSNLRAILDGLRILRTIAREFTDGISNKKDRK